MLKVTDGNGDYEFLPRISGDTVQLSHTTDGQQRDAVRGNSESPGCHRVSEFMEHDTAEKQRNEGYLAKRRHDTAGKGGRAGGEQPGGYLDVFALGNQLP